MIYVGSCDTEDCSKINKNVFYCNNIALYYFYTVFLIKQIKPLWARDYILYILQ